MEELNADTKDTGEDGRCWDAGDLIFGKDRAV